MFLGEIYMTNGVVQLIGDGVITKNEVMRCLSRHQRGDYGDTDPHDASINERNLDYNCGTVHSSYNINGNTIWIITSLGDVETTYSTLLLPNEY